MVRVTDFCNLNISGWMELQGEGRTVILPRNKAPLRSCGYFLRYRPPSIRDIVNDHWPAFMGGIILLAFIGECVQLS